MYSSQEGKDGMRRPGGGGSLGAKGSRAGPLEASSDMLSLSLVRRAAAFTSVTALVACSESPTADLAPQPTTIELSAPAVTFAALGDTVTVTATVRDQNGQAMEDVPVTWVTASQTVASVTDGGLVTATGAGSTTVTAVAGDADASLSVAVIQVPVRLRFAPDPVTLVEPEDTVTVAATIVDANDNPMPPEPVTWSVDSAQYVEVSQNGLVTAIADGRAVITATSAGVSGELAAFVGDAVVVIGSVSPSPMVVGSEAIIRGLGFSPNAAENDVRLDGIPAQITLASSVELRIVVPEADCRPPREGEVTVEAREMSDTASAAVRPEFLDSFEVGEGVYVIGGCLHMDAGSSDERYLVGILSASEVPSSLTPARLAARTGSRVLASPARATDGGRVGSTVPGRGRFLAPVMPSGGAPASLRADRAGPALDLGRLVASRPDRSGEAEIRAAERAWLESLGGVGPALAGARAGPLRAPPALGDTLDITVPDGCEEGTAVRAIVRHVGQSAAFLEDVENPVRPAFSVDQYRDLDEDLTQSTLQVLTEYFGDFADVDDNDLVLVLLTKEVNERENLAGFVFSGDLGTPQQCANSNQAEIFYGFAPDTAGVHGDPRTRADVLAAYPSLITHELTHILQFTAIFSRQGPVKSTWELEGGATLAEQLVGYVVQGDGPRLNLGGAEWDAGREWYNDWVVDMALYFGFDPDEPTVPRPNAPERCSWVGLESQGNTGPCENRRAVYGVPSTLLRYVLDQYGGLNYPGGDEALMKELTTSPYSGIETLERATGENGIVLLVQFGATLWADDRVGNWLLSWDIADIFGGLRPETQLRPYVRTDATPTLDVSVRAASNAYLLWTPPAPHDPTSLRIRTQVDDEPLPEHMALWVLRIQ